VATGILAFEGDGQVTAYAGNYTDYRERRAERDASRERTGPKVDKTEKRRASSKPRKLSYKEKVELEEIVGSIEQAETTAAEIEATLSDPKLYAERASEVRAIIERQREIQEELEHLMSRWMELEAISGG
jgi:ATP-binding cassette subfamily F protein uup